MTITIAEQLDELYQLKYQLGEDHDGIVNLIQETDCEIDKLKMEKKKALNTLPVKRVRNDLEDVDMSFDRGGDLKICVDNDYYVYIRSEEAMGSLLDLLHDAREAGLI